MQWDVCDESIWITLIKSCSIVVKNSTIDKAAKRFSGKVFLGDSYVLAQSEETYQSHRIIDLSGIPSSSSIGVKELKIKKGMFSSFNAYQLMINGELMFSTTEENKVLEFKEKF